MGGSDERRDVGGTDNRPAVSGEAEPSSASGRPRRAWIAVLSLVVLSLAGCSAGDVDSLKRLGLPVASSDRAPYIHDLWIGTWITAGIVGVGVWGLIGWVSLRYRRRGDLLPKQNRYNLPMEVFYTIAPFIIIGVLFYYTILAQDKVTARVPDPDHTIDVVGQKWSWTFNYKEAGNSAVGQDVWEAGTINKTPDLYLPVGKSVHFRLSSPDVIHSFWIPSFYEKLDVVPGRNNSFYATPNRLGVFPGKCAELCGTYHSAMIFNVHVVSEADYNAYLKTLAAAGQTGEAKGPAHADPQGSAKVNQDKERVGTK
ncbi:MAG: cytochrome c oxidase subunit II [Propionibacteriaceae bacterium]|nr:cytochrome c oxidase subunit II [Propionibacteriaceae bacterium]